MRKKLMMLILLCAAMVPAAAQEDQSHILIKKVDGTVDSLLLNNVRDIYHSRRDINGVEQQDISTLRLRTLGAECVYPLKEIDYVVMPNHGRYISFLGTTSTDDGQGGSNRTSVYSDDFLDVNQPVSYRWVANDRIYLSTGDQSENVRINSDSRVGSFTFRSDTLTADTYIVYYPGTKTDAFNKVIIPTEQVQKTPNNSDHLGASGDCGTATATRQANSSYSFSLDHKTAVLCFIPRVDSLETIRLKHIAVKSTDGKMLGGTYTLSPDGLSLVDETGCDTLTLKTSDFILPHNKQKPANADWEYIPQDTVASYMVIAPQSSRTPLKVYYRVYDTKSGIDTVIVKSSAINNQVKGATVYPVTHIIPVRAFFSAFTDSCKWSFGNPAQLYGSVNLPITHYGFIWGYNRNLTFATKEAQMPLDNYPTLTFSGQAVSDVKQKAYFYRAYAQEGDKTWFGKVKKFGMDREIIDLGTSVRWSSINMGAVTAEDRGKYYAWGELDTKETYTEGNYAYYNGSGQPYTNIGKDIAGLPAYDVVAKQWRGCWRMPTNAELAELYDNNKTSRKTITRENEDGESIDGVLFTGKGDEPDSIFVPKAGYYTTGPNLVNTDVLYWSSTEYDNKNSYRVYNNPNSTAQKYLGFPIRPVFDSNIETTDGKFLFIRTDSISYSADHTETDMYGTTRGLDDVVTDLTQGFVIGTAEDVTLDSSADVLKVTLTQSASDNGSYSIPLTKEQMNTLDVTSTYYVRAYLTYNDNTWYGEPKEMQAMTIQTDSTNWQVGMKEARLCGAVTGITEAVVNTTEFGFVVGTVADVNLDMPEDQLVKIKCNSTDNGKFVCNFTNIGFNQYYYRAYVNVGGRIAYGEPKMLGLEFVDLDLPSGLKWANINVGSQTPMDRGDHFSWGETSTKGSYYDNSTSYSHYREDIGDDINGTTYDAAQVNWKGPWRMPKKSDFEELVANCNIEKTTLYGTTVYKVTNKKKADKFIYLPANGFSYNNYLLNEESWRPLYWSSTRLESDQVSAYSFESRTNGVVPYLTTDSRHYGFGVRPVAMVNNTLDDESMIQMTTDSVHWEVGQNEAKLYGYLLGLRYNSKATESGFAYCTTPNFDANTAGVQYLQTNEGETNSVANGVMSATVPNVADETIYYYRAYVKVDGKLYFGNEREFGRRTVDLGLGNGVMWSNINLGASSSDDSGDYYAWGETTPKTSFDKPATYPDLGADIAGSSHDAATTAENWGGLWRMPTRDDVNDLITKCTWTEVTKYDQPMFKIVGPSGDSIFIAKRGSMNGTAVARDGERVMMWTSNLNTTDGYNHENAYGTSFYGTNRSIDAVARYLGYTIRPVIKYNKQHDQTKFYLTTDSTNWQVGVTDVRLVGAVAGLKNVNGVTRGFVVGCDSTSTALVAGGTDVTDIIATASATDNTFRGTLTYAKDTTYYYRAYVKIGDTYYYGNTRRYGLELVDMGNGIKWASINLGAQTSSEYGDRYAWGETTSKTTYTQATYTHYDGGYKFIGADISNKASYDAVKANWTGSWRMPTNAEMQWLVDNCDWEWTTEDGVAGYRVTSQTQNDKDGYNSIFLPAAGYQTGGYYQEIGSGCHYWTSVYYNDGDSYALIGNQAGDSVTAEHRYYGVSVRAVTTAGANEGGGGDITGGHNQGGSQGTGGDGNGSGNAGSGDTGGTIGN